MDIDLDSPLPAGWTFATMPPRYSLRALLALEAERWHQMFLGGRWYKSKGIRINHLDILLKRSTPTAIAGRAMVVDQVLDNVLVLTAYKKEFTAETDKHLLQLGLIGHYRSVPVVTIRNFRRSSNGEALVPPNHLALIGTNSGLIDTTIVP